MPLAFEDEPLLSLHLRVVLPLKPLLVGSAPVANAQSAGKHVNVFSQRLLFSSTFVADTSLQVDLDSDDISRSSYSN